MPRSDTETRGIRVRVESAFEAGRSDAEHGAWFFSYKVRIDNAGSETVQLLGRHWIITDAEGQIEEVRGPGVVGRQPVLEPGQSFEYTSGCPLGTPFGTMQGTYQMVTRRGDRFDVEIGPFALSLPFAIN